MKADIKTKWVAALRSGDYQQTDAVLRLDSHYCCLGVLCDLYSRETGVAWSPNPHTYNLAMHNNDNTLPIEVRVWAHLADEYGAYVEVETDEGGATHPPYLARPSLTELNDRWNYDFEQIADVIEQQL
jgi:hypothetical protein